MTYRKDRMMRSRGTGTLEGLGEIGEYIGRTPNTVRIWMRRHAFPVMKGPNGHYLTTRDAIANWIVAGAKVNRHRLKWGEFEDER